MIVESPLIQELVKETQRTAQIRSIEIVLEARFYTVPASLSAGLQRVNDLEALSRLTRFLATCASLEAFETALYDELSRSPSVSAYGRRGKTS